MSPSLPRAVPFSLPPPRRSRWRRARSTSSRAFLAEGFGRAGHRIVRHLFARSYAEYHRKISLRGLSSLQAISDGAFARGLAAFERHCRAQGAGPIYEPVELFVFRRT